MEFDITDNIQITFFIINDPSYYERNKITKESYAESFKRDGHDIRCREIERLRENNPKRMIEKIHVGCRLSEVDSLWKVAEQIYSDLCPHWCVVFVGIDYLF